MSSGHEARAGEFLWPLRVYYEDTDAGGVVYHAAYLRFLERARTEALRAAGIDQIRLREEDGLLLMVRRVEIDYLAPARLDEALVATARLERMGGASFHLAQEVRRGADLLTRAKVVCVCVGAHGATRASPSLRAALARAFHAPPEA